MLEEWLQVKSLDWEIDIGVELSTSTSTAIHTRETISALGLLKALQIDNKNKWGFVKLEGLGGLHMSLAAGAVPHIILIKSLRVLELLKTIIESN
jgi:hypothetical protein